MRDNIHPTLARIFESSPIKKPNELANLLNVSPTTVSNWARRGVSKDGAKRVSKKLGLTVDYILSDTPIQAVEMPLNVNAPLIQSMIGSFLKANRSILEDNHLTIIYAQNESMGHTIPINSPMLVFKKDNNPASLVSQKIYAFEVDGEIICKRVYKNIDGSLTLKSDNLNKADFPDQIIKSETVPTLNVLGCVCFVFNLL